MLIVAEPEAVKVPLLTEAESHDAKLSRVQLIELALALVKVKFSFVGLNGPPYGPVAAKPDAGKGLPACWARAR